MIGSKFSRHFFNQSEVKPKPIVARACTFSRLLCRLRVITLSFDCFTGLSPSFLIGQSNYFGFGFTTLRCNNSRITVKEYTGHSGLKSQSANISTYHGACGLKRAFQGCGQRLDHSEFRPMAEVSFPVLVSAANTKEKGPLRTGNINLPNERS